MQLNGGLLPVCTECQGVAQLMKQDAAHDHQHPAEHQRGLFHAAQTKQGRHQKKRSMDGDGHARQVEPEHPA